MAVSGVSLGSPVSLQNPNDPRQQFLQLAKAINAGDLAGAQQAFARLSQTLGASANPSNANTPTDPASQALAAIGQALQSGDIGAAQQALAALQQAQGARGHHHHRGHHADMDQNGAPSPSSGGTAPSIAPATTGATVDVTA